MSNTNVILSDLRPYTSVKKSVFVGFDGIYNEPTFNSTAVCGKILVNDKEIEYDYNKFSLISSENKEILNEVLNSFTDSKNISGKFYGSLEIYYQKNPEEKLEKYSVKISNKIYENSDGNYLKYILQIVCILFENNFLDNSCVIINRAILNVHSKEYNCTEDYVPRSDDEEYTTVIYDPDKSVGYEFRFKEIVSPDRGNSFLGKLVDMHVDTQTNTMQMFISHAENKALACVAVSMKELASLPYLQKPTGRISWV